MSGRALAAAALAALLLVLNLLPDRGRPGAALQPPLRHGAADTLALVVPGLFAESAEPGERRLGATPPPPGDSLARAAWLPADTPGGATARWPCVGLLPLLLAAVALLSAHGAPALLLRATFGLALLAGALAPAGVATPWAALLFVAALGGLAALELAELSSPPAADRSAAPGIALGSLAVALAAVLAGLALHAGAATDRALLDGLLERAGREPSPAVLALNAEWLRVVLDRAALAAFASMTALLLHLKSRNAFTLALVVLVSLADVASAGWL